MEFLSQLSHAVSSRRTRSLAWSRSGAGGNDSPVSLLPSPLNTGSSLTMAHGPHVLSKLFPGSTSSVGGNDTLLKILQAPFSS